LFSYKNPLSEDNFNDFGFYHKSIYKSIVKTTRKTLKVRQKNDIINRFIKETGGIPVRARRREALTTLCFCPMPQIG
jgi:hypothetical protein